MSLSLKGRKAPNKGIPMSEEQKLKLSKIKIGKAPPHLKGYHHNEETRRKMSESHKGERPWAKGKEWFVKKPRSEESKIKASQTMIERKKRPSKETLNKSKIGIEIEKRTINEISPQYDFIYKAESVCDAIAIKNNKIYLIEIKTGNSKLRKPQKVFKIFLKDKNNLDISYEVIRK